MSAHFKQTDENSIFGNLVYSRIIPQNHFPVKLKEEIPWNDFLPQLLPYYKGEGDLGNRPYHPVMILKMLFLSYLYDLSERSAEEFVSFNLPAKYFLGLGVDEPSPDHATLTVFKQRLTSGAGLLPYEQVFEKIVRPALDKGVVFGSVQAIDTTHVPADVNTFKDKMGQEKGRRVSPQGTETPPGASSTAAKPTLPRERRLKLKMSFMATKPT